MKPEKFDPEEKKTNRRFREPLAKKIETCEKQKSPKNESSRPIKNASVIRDQAKIFQDPRFSRYHSLPLPVDRISIVRSQA